MVSMSGERDLQRLLAALRPIRRPGRFVFVTAGEPLPDVPALAMVREDEGTTLVVEQDTADEHRLSYDLVLAMITLGVESALDAVGLTAAVASTLAAAGISCNVIAGFHHDHLFVPAERAEEAVAVLERLSVGSTA